MVPALVTASCVLLTLSQLQLLLPLNRPLQHLTAQPLAALLLMAAAAGCKLGSGREDGVSVPSEDGFAGGGEHALGQPEDADPFWGDPIGAGVPEGAGTRSCPGGVKFIAKLFLPQAAPLREW